MATAETKGRREVPGHHPEERPRGGQPEGGRSGGGFGRPRGHCPSPESLIDKPV